MKIIIAATLYLLVSSSVFSAEEAPADFSAPITVRTNIKGVRGILVLENLRRRMPDIRSCGCICKCLRERLRELGKRYSAVRCTLENRGENTLYIKSISLSGNVRRYDVTEDFLRELGSPSGRTKVVLLVDCLAFIAMTASFLGNYRCCEEVLSIATLLVILINFQTAVHLQEREDCLYLKKRSLLPMKDRKNCKIAPGEQAEFILFVSAEKLSEFIASIEEAGVEAHLVLEDEATARECCIPIPRCCCFGTSQGDESAEG
jgi:hypothetical protein